MITMGTMKKLMQNKLALLGIGAVIVVLVVVGVIFVMNKQKATKAPVIQHSPEEEAIQMQPQEIGLGLSANNAHTEVAMKISDVSKFSHFDFEMSYDALVDGETVPKGAIGSGDINPGDKLVDRKITIGTCSSGTCRYDKGVTKISLVLKLTLKDGKSAIVKKDLDFSGGN